MIILSTTGTILPSTSPCLAGIARLSLEKPALQLAIRPSPELQTNGRMATGSEYVRSDYHVATRYSCPGEREPSEWYQSQITLIIGVAIHR